MVAVSQCLMLNYLFEKRVRRNSECKRIQEKREDIFSIHCIQLQVPRVFTCSCHSHLLDQPHPSSIRSLLHKLDKMNDSLEF